MEWLVGRCCALWATVSALAVLALPSGAQAQVSVEVKPYFLVILDTSGSMHETTTCMSGTTNSCGWPCRRSNDAACVLQHISDGVGEAVFGLETFPLACDWSRFFNGNQQFGHVRSHYNFGSGNFACDPVEGDSVGTIQVPIGSGSAALLRSWVDGAATGCNVVNGVYQGDITGVWDSQEDYGAAVSFTPLAGSLVAARRYFEGATSPIRNDPFRGCRPYYVVMLTDGEETCDGNYGAAATALRSTGVDLNNNGTIDSGETFDIRTYSIGFGVMFQAGNGVETIARQGGTDAGGTGAPYAYYATNETQLSAGLNDIISRSILREVCNGRDDNCNGQVDEGYDLGGTCSTGLGVCLRNGVLDCDASGDGTACYTAARCSRGPAPGTGCATGTLLTPGTPSPATETLCNDSLDNDCDGRTDCADSDCTANPACSGACRSTGPEVCDGIDNDCNGRVDEGTITRPCGYAIGSCTAGTQSCEEQPAPGDRTGHWSVCSGVSPSTEVCDGIDNNCNGAVDEGLTRACGSMAGQCRAGVQRCVNGTYSGECLGSIGPTSEVCDRVDNDCDGTIDNGNPGGGLPCGSNTGVCRALSACVDGMIVCRTTIGPSTEICDGLDNDCNGAVDEGLTRACGSTTGQCRAGIERCIGGMFGGECLGLIGPSPEVCDGIDNNCNGEIDEGDPGGGAPCGVSGIGPCQGGVVHCVGGRLACTGGVPSMPELCDGIDNDCNGVIDDGVPGAGMACDGGLMFPMTPPVGTCRQGTTVCRSGMFVCEGAIGPSPEVCDGIDNNCNGQIDEGLGIGEACGSSVGACRPGALRCSMGRPACEGAIGPSPEVCDGIDNNCDGQIDEGNPGGGARCGNAVGECVPGVLTCINSMLVCDGARGPTPEVCDGLDNNCNNAVDEDLPVGGRCGSAVGRCRLGTLRCISGHEVCEGGVGPRPEVCNCEDDDCDGLIDNEVTAGVSLCGENAICAPGPQCQCLRRCTTGEFPCPGDRTCQRIGNDNLCVGDTCSTLTCGSEEECDSGRCRPRCEGITCQGGLVCNPRNGRCVINDCRGLGCAADQVCREQRCQDHPCTGITCKPEQACSNGQCVGSCADITCPSGQRCFEGTCRRDPCSQANCIGARVCDPSTGMCVTNRCTNVGCPIDQVCQPLTGVCTDDPCAVIRCPDDQSCRAGTCIAPPRPPRDRGIGAGGGGASCTVSPVPGRTSHSNPVVALGAFTAVFTVLQRRRRLARRRTEVVS